MPKFRARLESQEHDQFREVTLSRATEDEARNDLMAMELDYARHTIPDEELGGMLEAHSVNRKTGKVTGPDARTRGRLAAHYQRKPYEIVSIERVGR